MSRNRHLSTFALLFLASALHSQEVPDGQRTNLLSAARQKYYNLSYLGVKSFSCNVSMDWSKLFQSTGGAELPKDNPFLIYLEKAQISFVDPIAGTPEMKWASADPAPAGQEEALNQIRGGIKQMLEGFMTMWNPSVNGTLIPMNPDVFSATPTGYMIREKKDQDASETLNKELLVQQMSATVANVKTDIDLTFTPSPNGLLLGHSEVHINQPAPAPPVNVLVDSTFGTVDGFQIPSAMNVSMKNVGVFNMTFLNCKVQRAEQTKTQAGPAAK